MALVEIKDINFVYNGASENSLKNISLQINKGDFVVVCGCSGSGKSTLLRLLKKNISPIGKMQGDIFYDGINLREMSDKRATSCVGFVAQNPDSQIVTDRVSAEIAFGLENIGLPPNVIANRVAEVCSYLNINSLFDKRTYELSGGQKQLVNLASVVAMSPELIVLDEPTGQLDPVASEEFVNILYKLNEDLGITIVVAEHRLEQLFPLANRVLMLHKGELQANCEPKELVGKVLDSADKSFYYLMPTAVKLFYRLGGEGECPLTVKSGQQMVQKYFQSASEDSQSDSNKNLQSTCINSECLYNENAKISDETINSTGEVGKFIDNKNLHCEDNENLVLHDKDYNKADVDSKIKQDLILQSQVVKDKSNKKIIVVKDAYYKYRKDLQDVIKGLDMTVKQGDFLCILGANGSGKSTLLRNLSGLSKLYAGKIIINDKKIKEYKDGSLYSRNLAFLPQDVTTMFATMLVKDELLLSLKSLGENKQLWQGQIDEVCKKLDIETLLCRHPYDLSGGEQQRVAIAKLLLMQPKIILLDEPTKGMDGLSKKRLAEILLALKAEGKTIVMVTHDLEFAGAYADNCAMLFDGKIFATLPRQEFFCNNKFWTTYVNKVARKYIANAVSIKDLEKFCQIKIDEVYE